MKLIQITDNGCGIPADELPLALARHATSKIASLEDLERVGSLGFRGEALASIASVTRIALTSRVANAEHAWLMEGEGGALSAPQPAAHAVGSTIVAHDLFFNTPARRKFLKSPATEAAHIHDAIDRVALAYPGVHFRLLRGTRVVRECAATSQLIDRARQVLGAEIARAMAPFAFDVGRIHVAGLLSVAPSSFPHARHLFTYVNRRFVRDRVLTHAILHAYETLLMKDRYPAVVIDVALPFEDVDVNVHPAKHEVRFRRQSEVHEAVVAAVREGLKRKAKEPGRADATPPSASPEVREEALPYSMPSFSFPAAAGAVSAAPPREERATDGKDEKRGFFSSLDVLGQVMGCYLVCASAGGMALIDQHAAHERVAFEKMRHQLEAGEIEQQNLLLPQVVEMQRGEAHFLERSLETLARLGFTVEVFGPHAFVIKSVPALLPAADYREVLEKMVAELAEVGKSSAPRRELEERLMSLACHGVIRANRKLEREEIRSLLNALDEIDFATQCPHGRPVLLEFTEGELARMFRRV
jgi:DNA mismatch repair protein MutL